MKIKQVVGMTTLEKQKNWRKKTKRVGEKRKFRCGHQKFFFKKRCENGGGNGFLHSRPTDGKQGSQSQN